MDHHIFHSIHTNSLIWLLVKFIFEIRIFLRSGVSGAAAGRGASPRRPFGMTSLVGVCVKVWRIFFLIPRAFFFRFYFHFRFWLVFFESFLSRFCKISNDKPNSCSRKRRIEIEWASQNFWNIRQTKYFETFYRNFIGLRLRILISTPVIIMFVWFKHKRRQKRRQKKRRQKMEEVWKDKKSRKDPTSVLGCFAACFNVSNSLVSWFVFEDDVFFFIQKRKRSQLGREDDGLNFEEKNRLLDPNDT